ncbi:MAG: hypothetical protein JAY74_23675 [Candidatus Thiodiazotropha taylori]|nr:hypothetical protein [Candidatus Thiodiazotropha taylori]
MNIKKLLLSLLSIAVLTMSFSTYAKKREKPTYYNIEILSALIGPTKVNGRPWDPKSGANTEAIAAVVSEMMLPGSGITAASVVTAVSTMAPNGSPAPDIYGYIVQNGPTTKSLVKVAGKVQALLLRRNKSKNSYTPRLYGGYEGWPVYTDTRFRIQLWDADFDKDDHVAVIELNTDHLRQAAQKGEPMWINVAEQSMHQLLYVLISVIEITGKRPKPRMINTLFNR